MRVKRENEIFSVFTIYGIKFGQWKLENEFYYIKLENKTNVEINLSEGAKDYSLKGKYILAVLEKLNQCTDDYEKEIVSLALKLGIQCFTDEEVTVDDN